MVRLPDPYERRPVASGVRPIARVGNAGAVGAAVADLGQDIYGVGRDLDKVLGQQRQEEAAAAAADGEVAASAQIREANYDPEAGFLNTTGAAAVQGRDSALARLDSIPDQVLKGMPPDAAKRLRPVLMDKIETAKRQVDIHTSTQRTAWLNSASEARVANAIEDAKTRFGDPEAVQEHVGIAVAELKNRAEREGWPAEELDLAIEGVRATVARSYLEGVIRTDPVAVMEAGRRGEGSVLAALIEQESNGNPEAVSPKGAAGLMQVMPPTAAEVAREIGDRDFPYKGDPKALEEGSPEWREVQEYLKDPDVNVRYGTHYYRKQLRRYGGDVEAALIAYNGGPERADAWLKAGRDDSVIPAETRQYYKAVLGRAETGGGGPVDVAFRQLRVDDQLALMDKAERAAAAAERARLAQHEEAVARLEIAVGRGDAGYEEIERAFATGVIDASKLATLTMRLDGKTADVRAAHDRLVAGESFNVYEAEDRKLADALYENSDRSVESAFGIAAQTGIAPSPFVADIRQRTHQGDADAFELADQIMAQHPTAFEHSGGGEIAGRVDEFRGYARLGFSKEEAARRASRTNAERKESAAFGQDVTKELSGINDADVLNALPSIGATFFTPAVSDARRGRLRTDFETAYREARGDGVSADEATSVAAARLDRIWGLSEVNGEAEVMRFPPERYYPAGREGHGYIREQAVEDITGLTGAAPVELRFMSDRITEGDIKAGQPPRYRLFYVDADGFPQQMPGYFRADSSATQAELTEERRQRFELGRVKAAEARVEAAERSLQALGSLPGGASPELRERAEERLRAAREAIPKDAEEIKARAEERRRARIEAAQDEQIRRRIEALRGIPVPFSMNDTPEGF